MTPDQYCRHQLSQSGSSAHYSVLFLPPDRRVATTALLALQRELDRAAERRAEGGLAQASLHWWTLEIERLSSGSPQHPVTRALWPHLPTYDLSVQMLAPALHARHRLLQDDRFEDFESFGAYCRAASGVFGQMAARIGGARHPASLSSAARLAAATTMIRWMRDAGRLARAGRHVFPAQDLDACGVRPRDLLQNHYGAGFERLMGLAADRAWQELVIGPDTVERSALSSVIIAGVLYEALLKELERCRFRVLHQRIALTPIRKLLIAARTRALGPARGSALA